MKIEEKKLEKDLFMEEVHTWSNEKEDELRSIEREKQLEFGKEKLEMKLEYEKKSEEFKKGKQGESNDSHAKLPKLSITKFDGTFQQWILFWKNFARKFYPVISPSHYGVT